MTTKAVLTADGPGDELISPPALRPAIARLREAALNRVRVHGVPTLGLIDARSWAERPEDEDWLMWRARRTTNRLRAMAIELSPGERIVGRPELRPPTAPEQEELAAVQPVLGAIPPYPGGDSGHFHPDYEKLFTLGIGGILAEVRSRRAAADGEDAQRFYDACALALQGASDWAVRVAAACEREARAGTEGEWEQLAAICRRVATEPPATFHEAVQLMFLMTIALWFGEDHGLTAPGRMDQTLARFYAADCAAGRLTRDEARELIGCLYIQLNMILGSSSAVSVMVGGRDRHGQDVTNDLTYLCLEARLATRLVYPTVGLAWHAGTPAELTDFACRMLTTGIGDPAFFNDELIAQGLRDHGVAAEDCHNYMNSTCVEIKVCGASNMWVTAPYFNCPQALLDVMEQVATGTVPEPASFAELAALVRERLGSTVADAARSLDRLWEARAVSGCFPLASCVVSDCLARGRDFDRGGARYNWVENSFVGLANLADSMLAIKELVYEKQELSLCELRDILQADYEGHESLRQRILNTIPSYGNDIAEADALAAQWASFLAETTEANTVGPHRYVPGYFCWIIHERFGSATGATPDGRHAGFPLADGAGAAQGREKAGPTASILSTTGWSHRPALGGLVHNLKVSRNAIRNAHDVGALQRLIETYLQRGGFELQVNVVGAQVLRDAQAHPDRYPDLLVRVAGYSDYFVRLNPNMQAEVIARNEHGVA